MYSAPVMVKVSLGITHFLAANEHFRFCVLIAPLCAKPNEGHGSMETPFAIMKKKVIYIYIYAASPVYCVRAFCKTA